MDKFKKKNSRFALILICSCFGLILGGAILSVFQDSLLPQRLIAAEMDAKNSVMPMSDDLRNSLNQTIHATTDWPLNLNVGSKKMSIDYALNSQLDNYVRKLLRSYRSDYSSVVVMNNETGEVLAAVGVEGKGNKIDNGLVLSSTHPSASLIKMITAAELMENSKVGRETNFDFKGRSTTLFKYQLKEAKDKRWVKSQSFETAFAISNNVIFGKAAIEHLNTNGLVNMAEKFGFNQNFMSEFDFLKSSIRNANEDFHFAEIASGFNDETVISPLHAAMMSSIVANNGMRKSPILIKRIMEGEEKTVWENNSTEERALSLEASKEMQEMMKLTVQRGTAKKSFRKMNKRVFASLDIGGKTGSITGGKPFGKRDWFSAYAVPVDPTLGKGISISVMNVNVKKWHVKSTMLAKDIIEYYYRNIEPLPANAKTTVLNELADTDMNVVNKSNKRYNNKRSLAQTSVKKKPSTKKKVTSKRTTVQKKVVKKSSPKRVIASKKQEKQKKKVVNKSSNSKVGKNNVRKSNASI